MNQSTNSYLTHSQRSTTRNMKKPAADPCSTSAWNAEGIRSSFRMRKPFSKRSIVDCFAKRADSTFRINTENERSIFIDAHYRFPIAKLKSGTQSSPVKYICREMSASTTVRDPAGCCLEHHSKAFIECTRVPIN